MVVGCVQPLARMGATVTGVDAVDKNIKVAHFHGKKLVEEQREFDAVLALEVIEHVADPTEFADPFTLDVAQGDTVISIINCSMRAYATAIVAAEYLLQ